MKKTVFVLFAIGIIIFTAMALEAAQVTLAWNFSSGATGYKVYYGTESRVYNAPDDAGDADHFTLNLDPGDYKFAITAYNNYGESDYSEEVVAVISPDPIIVENGTGIGNWERMSGLGAVVSDYNAEGDYNYLKFSSTGATALTKFRLDLSAVADSYSLHFNSQCSWTFLAAPTNTMFLIAVETTQGSRNLYYRFLDTNSGTAIASNLIFGIGIALKDSQWHTISRNLQADLQLFQPANDILRVNYFHCFVYGLGETLLVREIKFLP